MGFCGVTAKFGDGSAQMRLETTRPLIWLDPAASLPNFSRQRLRDAIMAGFGMWAKVSDAVADLTEDSNAAQFVIFTTRLDGPQGVLADCEMPGRGYKPQRMRIDNSERFDTFIGQQSQNGDSFLDLVRIIGHEGGHAYGLPHLDDNGKGNDLMDSLYNPKLWEPSQFEADYMARWFGKPKTPPPTPALPPTTPGSTILELPLGRYRIERIA